jgi:peptidoglycan/xylan/chitin deacetylase (PgdA/CDA1 family)
LSKFDTNYKILPALTKIPAWLQVYNKDICWKISGAEKTVYLSFDDGPHPQVTPQVLDILKLDEIKATFFCIGQNVELYPSIYQRILNEGHSVGNHSYSHRSGWKINVEDYVIDVKKASGFVQSTMFRPPYGRITPLQFKVLKHQYKIIMWDVLSKDYDVQVSDEQVISNVTDHISSGSIIVMHDNEKTVTRMGNVLPKILHQLQNQGWKFAMIPSII